MCPIVFLLHKAQMIFDVLLKTCLATDMLASIKLNLNLTCVIDQNKKTVSIPCSFLMKQQLSLATQALI